MAGSYSEHLKTVRLLKSSSAQIKVIIPGNHDITLDPDFYATPEAEAKSFGTDNTYPQDLDAIRALYDGPEAQAAGIVLMIEGVRTFTLAHGATFTLYASAYQPEFCGWAFAYERDNDRYNISPAGAPFQAPNPVPDATEVPIDIMLTHGPPAGVLDRTYRGEHVGCGHLLRAVQRARPRLHVFGHIHEGWGATRIKWGGGAGDGEEQDRADVQIEEARLLRERAAYVDITRTTTTTDGGREGGGAPDVGSETLFVNASIMTMHYSPRNAPWIVDLDLPRATTTERNAAQSRDVS